MSEANSNRVRASIRECGDVRAHLRQAPHPKFPLRANFDLSPQGGAR
jgi:hypothetical protein